MKFYGARPGIHPNNNYYTVPVQRREVLMVCGKTHTVSDASNSFMHQVMMMYSHLENNNKLVTMDIVYVVCLEEVH